MESKRKRGPMVGVPSLDQFHDILRQLPERKVKFTRSAVVGLRLIYHTYMQKVAASLTKWDSLNGDDSKIVKALEMDNADDFQQITRHAQELLVTSNKNHAQTKPPSKKSRKRRRIKITADMEADQERLLKQSRRTMIRQQQK